MLIYLWKKVYIIKLEDSKLIIYGNINIQNLNINWSS